MRSRLLLFALSFILIGSIYAFRNYEPNPVKPEECVFNTVFGEIELDPEIKPVTSPVVKTSIKDGWEWLKDAQHPDGGWGAGFHRNQRELDPHKVPADPATTAMVAMALLRSKTTVNDKAVDQALNRATEYLLKSIESSNNGNITNLTGTQIQRKLGQNIDVVLTTQFLTNLLDHLDKQSPEYDRVFKALGEGVEMVQNSMDNQGKSEGAGWAGVLQSAYATSALESAENKGAKVDKKKLEKSKDYQTSNYNPVSESVDTKDGAGIMLYSVSGSIRANAQRARKAKEKVSKAVEDGVLDEVVVSYDNLRKIGFAEEEAIQLETASRVYNSAKVKAQAKDVVAGYGNNGGEEFLSFLQTGESLVINKDDEWKKWYDSMSATLTGIQNNDGSWNGHHCITSPVFCTATCMMILSINNDIDNLQQTIK